MKLETKMPALRALIAGAALLAAPVLTTVQAQSSRYDALATIPYNAGYPSKEDTQLLVDELLFQRAVQAYLWAQPKAFFDKNWKPDDVEKVK
jgi:hypothetical protein